VGIGARDVAELIADPVEHEERASTFEGVLGLRQLTLLERARQGVVLRRGERRKRPLRRRGRLGRPRAGAEQKGECKLGETHD
jgi:hypothetical protein